MNHPETMNDQTHDVTGKPLSSSLEKIGISDQFQLSESYGLIITTKPATIDGLTLEGQQVVAQLVRFPFFGAPQQGYDYSLMFFYKREGNLEPVGHVDFRRLTHEADNTICSLTNFNTQFFKDNLSKLPPHIQRLVTYFQTTMSGGPAMALAKEFQGKGLGGLMWALGLGCMEKEGVKTVAIRDDQTKDIKEGKPGFYERYGSSTRVGKKIKFVLGRGNVEVDTEEQFAFTHLNEGQEKLLRQAFEKIDK